MNTVQIFQLVASALLAFLVVPVLARLVGLFAIEVEHEEAVLITRFGRLARIVTHPGWHWLADRKFTHLPPAVRPHACIGMPSKKCPKTPARRDGRAMLEP